MYNGLVLTISTIKPVCILKSEILTNGKELESYNIKNIETIVLYKIIDMKGFFLWLMPGDSIF